MFRFWDWVGGRYSLWSAIGLSIACTIGFENFVELLDGAHDMDMHFRRTPFEGNIPVILALIRHLVHQFLRRRNRGNSPVRPVYAQVPCVFPAGEHGEQRKIRGQGRTTNRYQTGPVIWGEPGTNGQHAFYQLIHQGTKLIPCDFIAPAISHNPIGDHHAILLSNFFAQTEALMKGKTHDEVIAELRASGMSDEKIKVQAPFRVFQGNRPTNSILFRKLYSEDIGKPYRNV